MKIDVNLYNLKIPIEKFFDMINNNNFLNINNYKIYKEQLYSAKYSIDIQDLDYILSEILFDYLFDEILFILPKMSNREFYTLYYDYDLIE